MKLFRDFVLSIVIGLAVTVTATGTMAATLNFDSLGKLNGASGVLVGSSQYNVQFIDKDCINVFGSCSPTSTLAFSTSSEATLASWALLNQVFLNQYNDQPIKTYGIERNDFGKILTVYQIISSRTSTNLHSIAAMNVNATVGADTVVSDVTKYYWDMFDYNERVYAKWTEVSAVPLPAALPFYGAGLAVMGFIGWRRKRNAKAA